MFAFVHPLVGRIAQGEGGLAVMASLYWLAASRNDLLEAIAPIASSWVLLLALYVFNDIIDAVVDQTNPRKNHVVAQWWERNQKVGYAYYGLLVGLSVAGSHWAIGPIATAATGIVIVINMAYSLRLKATPKWDIPFVALWGGFYLLACGVTGMLVIAAALMVGIMHLHQIWQDRDADIAQNIFTSASLAPNTIRLIYRALTVLLVATIGFIGLEANDLQPQWSLIGLVGIIPQLAQRFVPHPAARWHVARLACGGIWILLLYVEMRPLF